MKVTQNFFKHSADYKNKIFTKFQDTYRYCFKTIQFFPDEKL